MLYVQVVEEQFRSDVEIARNAIPTATWKLLNVEHSGNACVSAQNQVCIYVVCCTCTYIVHCVVCEHAASARRLSVQALNWSAVAAQLCYTAISL